MGLGERETIMGMTERETIRAMREGKIIFKMGQRVNDEMIVSVWS